MFRLILVLSIISLCGCATELTSIGQQVRLVDKQSDYSCEFIATVTASNEMGSSTAHDAEGAMNELRNKAGNLGANAARLISVSSSPAVTTIIGEALRCKF